MTFKKENAAHTSRADKVIDAVSEVRKDEKPKGFVCVKCSGTSYTPRNPLGGPLIQVCNSCGHKQAKARGNTSALRPENLTHKQGTGRGPTWSATPAPKPDKHQHAYRRKGKKR